MVRIVLDTGVLFYPGVLSTLASRSEDVVIPAVALAERVRQLARDGRDEDLLHRTIAAGGYITEALTPDAACRVARQVKDDTAWRRLSRDAFIAAHVQPGDELWTTNPKDFLELGLPPHQVVAVPS